MEGLNNFVITLATIIIFISAVELIFPNNSFKKYQSFVLGLIVLATIITPIIKIFDSTESLGDRVKVALEKIEMDSNEQVTYSEEKNSEYIIFTLKNNCERALNEKFTEKDFTVDIDGEVDLKNYETDIKSVKVNVRNKGQFEPIIINQEEKIQIKESKLSNDIKDYLGNELKVNKELILVIER